MKIEVLQGGICAVKGVKAYGLKEGNKGLALIEGEGIAVGMFTSNKIKAAPVQFTQKQLERSGGRVSAIIANSGCANSYTGEQGMRNAEKMAELVSSSLGVRKEEVAVASTGHIGKQLDMELIERQLGVVVKALTSEVRGSTAAAKAIMTTDTALKELAVRISISPHNGGTVDCGIKNLGSAYSSQTDDGVVIGGIAKGSGMIFPHLTTATMLCFIYTDAYLDEEALRRSLKEAVDNSFNAIVVDGDMSTNDLVLLVSTGNRGEIREADFKTGLNFVCTSLAKRMAKDGEGATKLIEVRVKGAASVKEAREIAIAVVRSPLVKSAIFGERTDLTCGRIIAAIGSCTTISHVDPGLISIRFKSDKRGEVLAVNKGEFVALSGAARNILKSREIFIEVEMGVGEVEATAWGCDLTYDYVKINAA
ncbi:MAG: bifunctional ornithine acetyltransferase/N-acetylglutamate synthase [Halobacteriota archaeon]